MIQCSEPVIEEVALAWLETVGWRPLNGAEIATGEPAAERDDYGRVVLTQRPRDALLHQRISGELRAREVARATKEPTA